MKKKVSIIMCFIFIVFSFVILNKDKYKVEEFKSVINAKTYMDPATTYMTRVDINLSDKAKISPVYTYLELMHLFENDWTSPDGVHYDGSNVYFAFCPTSSPCDYKDTTKVNGNTVSYSEVVKGDRYHWVDFEIGTIGCVGDDTVCEYDFDKNNLDKIEVYLNGSKVTNAIIDGYYNPYWHSIDVYIPMAGYTGAIVRDINVESNSNYVQKGTTSNFVANVRSYGAGSDGVSWTVTGNESNNTTINSSGVLTVAADETSLRVKVRATSTYDNTIYGEKEVEVIDEPLSITDVTFTNMIDKVVYGGSFMFSARGNGTGNRDVTWSITGANNPGTTIDSDGMLNVSEDETATSIVVTATSVFDSSKKANLTVSLRNTEYITKIEINYDTSRVVFSSKTTYNDVRNLLERIWELPENANYDKGNNNIWIGYCETSERCTSNLTMGYGTNMLTDRYTYVEFEIFAKPSDSSGSNNPLYDFDKNNLGDIEIWVNGEKREDAFAYLYNSYSREVDVLVPVTVTNGKINQDFNFNRNEMEISYGNTSNNGIVSYNRIGDGEITWSSSNTDIATVLDDGTVTAKKVGTCEIIAHASETENYNEFSKSYTLVVVPKYISPSVSGYESNYDYTGSQIKPSVTVEYNDLPLVENVDYTISYDENTNVGYGRIYIYPVDGSNYTFSETSYSFYISRKAIQDENVTISPTSVIYDGNPKTVDITVIVDGRTLVKDTDYTVNYSSNTNVGTAYIYITGIGNYGGSAYTTFEITEAPEYDKGDMNGDGEITLSDVIYLLKVYLGVVEPTDMDDVVGDMNDDGNIGLVDIILLLRKYLGIE